MAAKEDIKKLFPKVAREIGPDWTTLARDLNLSYCVIQNIQVEFDRTEDKAYEALMKWYQAKGQRGATIEVLGKALQAIGKKSIAEEIGFYDADDHEETKQRDTCEDIEVSNQSKSPAVPCNNDFMLESLGKEVEKVLRYCQDSIPSCGSRAELGHILKLLEFQQAMNEKIMIMTSWGSFEQNKNDTPEIARIKTAQRVRHEHIDQTIRLARNQLMKLRPVSEILHRCTSIVFLPRRSNTDSVLASSQRHISSSASTTSSHPLPSHELVCIGKTQIVRCCSNCGSCFAHQTRVSGNEEESLEHNDSSQSNPDGTLQEKSAYNEHGPHNSKL